MRLGLFMMPVHPPGRSLSETLAEDTAKSLLADRLGYMRNAPAEGARAAS